MAGEIIYDNGVGLTANTAGASGQSLLSGGAGAPTWGVANTLGFSAYASAALSNVTGDNTFYQVVFNTTVRNDGTMYNTSTGLLTIPNTGMWSFAASTQITGMTIGSYTFYSLLFELNTGAQIGRLAGNADSISFLGGQCNIITSTLIQLTAAQTVVVRFQVAGGAKTVSMASAAASYQTRFSGCLIGV